MSLFVLSIFAGVALSGFIQGERVRAWLTRIGLGKNAVNLLTSAFSLTALISCMLAGLNLLGVPINWDAPIPGLRLSIAHLIRSLILLSAVFWLSSWAKRFLFNNYLRRMGTDRALQYAIAQIISYVVLIIGIFIVQPKCMTRSRITTGLPYITA